MDIIFTALLIIVGAGLAIYFLPYILLIGVTVLFVWLLSWIFPIWLVVVLGIILLVIGFFK